MSGRSRFLVRAMFASFAVCGLLVLWVIVALLMIVLGWGALVAQPIPFVWPWLPISTLAYIVAKFAARSSLRRDEIVV